MSRTYTRSVVNSGLSKGAVSPIIEESGYTTVQHKKPSGLGAAFSRNPGQATSPLAPLSANRSNINLANKRNSRFGASPPSVAASYRADVYELPHKAPSMFRNSVMGSMRGPPDLRSTRIQKLSKSLFKPGMIVRAAVHEPDLHGTAGGSAMTLADRYTTESRFGTIHSKYRKMIVIALYETHYLAIPLYTHNGNGVAHKSKPDEYISVRDHRSPGPFSIQTVHGELVTDQVNAGIHPYDPNSLAHITYPVARKYDLPLIVEGQLGKRSAKHLWSLYDDFVQASKITV